MGGGMPPEKEQAKHSHVWVPTHLIPQLSYLLLTLFHTKLYVCGLKMKEFWVSRYWHSDFKNPIFLSGGMLQLSIAMQCQINFDLDHINEG